MNARGVLYMLGKLLITLALLLVVPAGVAFAHEGPDRWPFVGAMLLVGGLGFGLSKGFRQSPGFAFGRKEAFLLVSLAWVAATAVGALPWILTKGPGFTIDALFESAAGFSTTGASILNDIAGQPAGLLFWRSMSQWLGGMGIIVLGIAILPKLSSGGVALLSAEAPGPIQEKLTPRIARTAKALWGIYLLLTLLEFGALWLAGMTPLEAVHHAFTTLSTGGFSTRNGGVGEFQSVPIELIITAFMILAGMNFAVFFHLFRGKPGPLLRDPEVRLYLGILLTATAVIAFDLTLSGHAEPLESLRQSSFQVVSIQTTTGFGTADFDAWPPLSKGLLFLLFFSGGCAGSTSGSVKVVRIQILLKKVVADMRRMAKPHVIVPIRQGTRVIPPDVVTGVTSFVVLFVLLWLAGGFALLMLDGSLDGVSAFSACAACLGNIGPGFGLVGPTQNFASLEPVAKLLLTSLMIVGRLELYTVLVLLWMIPRRKRAKRKVVGAARQAAREREPRAEPPLAKAGEDPAPPTETFSSARYPRAPQPAEDMPTEERERPPDAS